MKWVEVKTKEMQPAKSFVLNCEDLYWSVYNVSCKCGLESFYRCKMQVSLYLHTLVFLYVLTEQGSNICVFGGEERNSLMKYWNAHVEAKWKYRPLVANIIAKDWGAAVWFKCKTKGLIREMCKMSRDLFHSFAFAEEQKPVVNWQKWQVW